MYQEQPTTFIFKITIIIMIPGVFLLTCPRFSEAITFYYQDIAIIVLKGRLKISVYQQNFPKSFLIKVRLLHVFELSNGPIRV